MVLILTDDMRPSCSLAENAAPAHEKIPVSATAEVILSRDGKTYETHDPSMKTRISKSRESSGCNRVSVNRLARGFSQLWMDTRKGAVGCKLGMNFVRTGSNSTVV